MVAQGRILLSDDEETFLLSTARLLHRRGYNCDCASDGQKAVEMLRATRYDLLIADIQMPGNADLELIRLLPSVAGTTPAILVTGYPSLSTAIEAVQLPVVSYMVKPVDFDRLLHWAEVGMAYSQTLAAFDQHRQQLQTWDQDLATLQEAAERPGASAKPVTFGAFMELAARNLSGLLDNLANLSRTALADRSSAPVCHLFNCPRTATLIGGLEQAVEVISKTRTSFKSSELADLRHMLERLLSEAKTPNTPRTP